MELISEQKIIDSINSNRTVTTEIEAYTEGFTSGVSFSENELKNLAIEYSEWLSTQKDYSFCKSKNVWTLYGKSGEFDLTSKQLFDKFINQRNKS